MIKLAIIALLFGFWNQPGTVVDRTANDHAHVYKIEVHTKLHGNQWHKVTLNQYLGCTVQSRYPACLTADQHTN